MFNSYLCFISLPTAQSEAVSGHSKKTGLVIYLAFLAKVANLYYILLAAFKKYWPDTVAKFISGTGVNISLQNQVGSP